MENKFDECTKSNDKNHKWIFHVDAASSGGPKNKPWQSFFMCTECNSVRNASEKYQLDGLKNQSKFLKNAKIQLWIAVISILIGMGSLTFAALTFIHN